MDSVESAPDNIAPLFKIERRERAELFSYIQARLDGLCQAFGESNIQTVCYADKLGNSVQLLKLERARAVIDSRGRRIQRNFYFIEAIDGLLSDEVTSVKQEFVAIDEHARAFTWQETYKTVEIEETGLKRYQTTYSGPSSPPVESYPYLESGNPVIFPTYNWQPEYYEEFVEFRNRLEDLSFVLGSLAQEQIVSTNAYEEEARLLWTRV